MSRRIFSSGPNPFQWRPWRNWSPRDRAKLNGDHYAVPGCIPDKDPRKDFKHKFDKWKKLPQAAHRLYWRTHPELYEATWGRPLKFRRQI